MSLRPGDELSVEVSAAAAGGESLARTAGGIVFVRGAIPAETVRVRIAEVKRGFARADVTEVLLPSPHRVPDRRVAMGAAGVGGIEFAHVDLAHSRALKAQAGADQLRRIGGIDVDLEVLAAPLEDAGQDAGGHAGEGLAAGTAWRTRAQLAVADGRPGNFAQRSHDVVGVEHVPLAVPAIDALGLQHMRLPGVQRLEVAAGSAGTEPGGAVVVSGQPERAALAAVQEALEAAPGEWSVLLRGSGTRNRARASGRGGKPSTGALEVLRGDGQVRESVAGLDFALRGDGFWQVHSDAAELLSARVVEASRGYSSVLDLYCGAGLFSLRVAAATGAQVHGVEGSTDAIAAARANAQRNPAAASATFDAARIERLDPVPAADCVIVDPPRAGLGEGVVDLIADSAASRLIYVSCDGATFARDARRLLERGFSLTELTGLDLFPLTGHVEYFSIFDR